MNQKNLFLSNKSFITKTTDYIGNIASAERQQNGCVEVKNTPNVTNVKVSKTSTGGGLCSVIGAQGSRAGRRISTFRSCSQNGSDLFPALVQALPNLIRIR